MLLLVLFLAMSLAVALFMAAPLVGARNDSAAIRDADYLAAQIGDIERDLASGMIDAAEAQSALVEARRRLLADAKPEPKRADGGATLKIALALVALAPVATFAIYAMIGNPARTQTEMGLALAVPAMNPADMSPEERNAMIGGMVEGLAARLQENPDDIEGWKMLGRSYAVLERFDDSADAYAKAYALAPDDVQLLTFRAEALIAKSQATGAAISDDAQDVVEELNEKSPGNPFALFFLGLAASERGDAGAARQYWEQLLAVMPDGAPQTESLKAMLEALPPHD